MKSHKDNIHNSCRRQQGVVGGRSPLLPSRRIGEYLRRGWMDHFCVCDGRVKIVNGTMHVKQNKRCNECGQKDKKYVACEEFKSTDFFFVIGAPKYTHFDEFEQTEEGGGQECQSDGSFHGVRCVIIYVL